MPPQPSSRSSAPRNPRASGSSPEGAKQSRTSALRVSKVMRRRRRVRPPDRITVPILLRKFCELSVMAGLIGAAFAYQFMLPESWNARIGAWVVQANGGSVAEGIRAPLAVFLADLIPGLTASLPILELKTTVWLLAAAILVAVHATARVYEAAAKRPVFAPDLSPVRGWRNPWRTIPIAAGVAFMAWGLLSFSPATPLNWAPQMPPEALEATGATSAQAGMYQSTVSWIQVALGLAFLLSAEDVIRTRRYVYKLLGLIMGLGTIAAVVSILVQARFPPLHAVWVKWGSDDFRNDVGGVIGHNTAVSSFAMAPMLIAWTMLMSTAPERRGVRGMLAGCLATMVLLLVMAQSRAVIPIVGAAFVALVLLLARRASLKPGLRFLVAVPLAMLAVLVTQFVDHPANPLYRRNLPLAERLKHVTVQHLHTETRLRMMVVSIPVIREHLLKGTGWGTFHYVVPTAQGDYYAANPQSSILPTPKKSFHAHNEYLQTLFETGATGLALALVGVGTIVVAGWRSMRQSFRQRHIALQLAVFAGICALLAHSFFDFPLRVAPLACTLTILLAIWSAGDRLWVIHTRQLAERPLGGGMAPTEEGVANYSAVREIRAARRILGKPARGRKGTGPAMAGWALCGALALLGVVAGGTGGLQWFSSLVAGMNAQAALDHSDGLPPGQGAAVLQVALASTQTSHRLSPLNGETLFREAQAHQYVARQFHMAGAEASAERREAFRREALAAADRSLLAIDRSMAEYYYHGSWRVRALANYLRFVVDGGRARDIAAAVRDLDRCVRTNPGDFESAAMLAEWMERWNVGERARLVEVHRAMRHFFPEFHHDRFVKAIGGRIYVCDYDEALRQANLLLEADGTDQTFLLYARSAAFHAGDIDALRELNARLSEVGDSSATIWRVLTIEAESAVGDAPRDRVDARLQEAATIVDGLPAADEGARRRQRSLAEPIALRRAILAENPLEAEAALVRLREGLDREPELLAEAASNYYAAFRDAEGARRILELRLQHRDFVPVGPWTLKAHLLLAPWRPKIDGLLEARRAAEREGREPEHVRDELLRGVLREAADALLKARGATMPEDTVSRTVVDARLREIELLLGPEGAAAAPAP